MNISTSAKLKIKAVIYIVFSWLILSLLIVCYNHFFYTSVGDYDFRNSLITTVIAVLVAGIVGGSLIVFVLRKRFRRQPLGIGLISYAATILMIIAVITILASFFYNSLNLGLSVFHPGVLHEAKRYLLEDQGFILNIMTWSGISFLTVLALQVNDKYGQGVFMNMLLGRYHQPKQEDRIFMFLDIRSSTSIAERLGNIRYFKLLSKFFGDISRPVIESSGEIYQYVGDEVVISWPLDRGLEQSNALKCFFRIEEKINKNAETYMEEFGLIPEFKAGLHYGEVTIGEIGTIKKDIIFSGDVLNTTSRIQDMCNKFNVKLLVSGRLLDLIPETDQYQVEKLEQISLRGKQRPITLYSVVNKETQLISDTTYDTF